MVGGITKDMYDVKSRFIWGVPIRDSEGKLLPDEWDYFKTKGEAVQAARERNAPFTSITKFLLTETTEVNTEDEHGDS